MRGDVFPPATTRALTRKRSGCRLGRGLPPNRGAHRSHMMRLGHGIDEPARAPCSRFRTPLRRPALDYSARARAAGLTDHNSERNRCHVVDPSISGGTESNRLYHPLSARGPPCLLRAECTPAPDLFDAEVCLPESFGTNHERYRDSLRCLIPYVSIHPHATVRYIQFLHGNDCRSTSSGN